MKVFGFLILFASIVHGNVNPGDYPMIISLQHQGSHHCSGIILTPTKLLTSASCVDYKSSRDFEIWAGLSKSGDEETFLQKIPASSYLMSPHYINSIYVGNVALLTLSSPLQFNDQIQPGCIPSQDNPDSVVEVKDAWLVKWTSELNGFQKEFIDFTECDYSVPGIFCGKGICSENPGAPLFSSENSSQITGIGASCIGEPTYYGFNLISTRIGRFSDWIVQNAPGTQIC